MAATAHLEPRAVILIVEDEPLVRLFLADFLDEAGFKVFEAVNADEALLVLQARPDVQALITDIEMPGSASGLSLARTVHERWPGVKVVVTSGRAAPHAGDDLPPGAAFLTKPYWPETVIDLLRQMIVPVVVEPRAESA